ncbi:hypothetical protein ACQPXB_12070 [Amycolatopsis sp. CA-161197]|uniref:hypothetical protein n=1 Tax=unclassified Amycolatopsis TaxID=2618356 RepID=UPI003454CF55
MSESDLLCQMFEAWRDDIESVPFPQFTTLVIPPQPSRAQVDACRSRDARKENVMNPTHWNPGHL